MKFNPKQVLWPIGIVAAGAAVAVLWWTMNRPAAQLTEPTVSGTVIAAAAPEPAATTAPQSELQPANIPEAAQPLAVDQIDSALTAFLGSKATLTFFQLTDFPRRFVATVDNLGRSHAPPVVWPINLTEGRFNVQTLDGSTIIGSDNALRYKPLVLLLEKINVELAVDLYVRMYPVLQQTYEDLGYPNRQFNDRLLQVLDHLLATPIAPQVIAVQLTEVKGAIPSLRPWVRYEFADPALKALSSGQKIMLRVGSVNQSSLKAMLSALRQEILKRSTEAQ